jgi:NTE family protein
MSSFAKPDVLVLCGGGVLGEAWMTGVLAGIEDAAGLDVRELDRFVGTSAGSIVSARLAAGRRLRRPAVPAASDADSPGPAGSGPTSPSGPAASAVTAASRVAASAISPLVDPLLMLGAPGGAIARAILLARVPRGERTLDELVSWLEHIGARFDGRLRVCCVDRASGRRVVFGAPGAPPAPVSLAVAASCSIPGVFAPVTIGGREYVDGGAWSQANLDAAPVGRSTRVLCLNPVLGLPSGARSPWRMAYSAWRARAQLEELALRRRGAHVSTIGPSPAAGAPMSAGLMQTGPRQDVHAAGYAQGLEVARG